MNMTLPLFVEKICSHRGACVACRRDGAASDQWRTAMQQAFAMPAGWPMCPIGLPMGATAEDVKATAGGCVWQCDHIGPPVETIPSAVLLDGRRIKTNDGSATLGDLVLTFGEGSYDATSADGKFFVQLKWQAGDSGGGSYPLTIIDNASKQIAWEGCLSSLQPLQPTGKYTRLCRGGTCDANLGVSMLGVS